MPVEPEPQPKPTPTVSPRAEQPGRRRLLGAVAALTGLVGLSRFFKDATAAHAQADGETAAGGPPTEEVAAAAPKITEDFSNPEASIFQATTEGEGYRSAISDGTLTIEALPGGSGIATASSKPETTIPRGAAITAEVQTDGGFIIGRGNSNDYVRASVFRDGTIRIQTVTRQGNGFQANPLGEGRVPGITDGSNNLSLRLGDGALQLTVNGQLATIPVAPELTDKYDGSGIVLGALGSNRGPAKAVFDNVTAG